MQYAKTTLLNTATLHASNVSKPSDGRVIANGSPPYLENYGLRVVKPVNYNNGGGATSHSQHREIITKPENDKIYTDSEDSDSFYAAAKSRPLERRESQDSRCSLPHRNQSDLIDGEPILPQPPAFASSCSDDVFVDMRSDYLTCPKGCPVQHFFRGDRVVYQEADLEDRKVGLSRTVTKRTDEGDDVPILPLYSYVKSLRSREVQPQTATDYGVRKPSPSSTDDSVQETPSSSSDDGDQKLSPSSKSPASSSLVNFGFRGVGSSRLLRELESKLSVTRETVASTFGHYSDRTNKIFANIETEIIAAALSAVLPTFVPVGSKSGSNDRSSRRF